MLKHKILFVCLGNICRSPTAEEVFRSVVNKNDMTDDFQIDSAGTYGGHSGDLPDPRMRVAASHRGYKLTHRSRQIGSEDFELFNMIVVMDDSNYECVTRLAPNIEALNKIYRMTDFCKQHHADHIPDPYYEGAQGFEMVLDLLEDACGGLFEELKNNRIKI